MAGIDNPKTMKFLGKIEETEIVVMIDTKATHNSILSNVVEEHGKIGEIEIFFKKKDGS